MTGTMTVPETGTARQTEETVPRRTLLETGQRGSGLVRRLGVHATGAVNMTALVVVEVRMTTLVLHAGGTTVTMTEFLRTKEHAKRMPLHHAEGIVISTCIAHVPLAR